MATATIESAPAENLADLVRKLGRIPLERILAKPAPGKATEKDLIAALEAPRKRICELVDGVLVEKAMGTKEAVLAGWIVHQFWTYLGKNDLGVPIPADGPSRLWLGLVRIPDVSFVSWDRIPVGGFPDQPIASLVPDLAIEVLSKGNTPGEMARKLGEYFKAGVQLVWLIDPKKRTARVYTSPTSFRTLHDDESLDGGDILPGFLLPLKQLFAMGDPKRKRR
jgi:Uma2 family endonuclease